ncbi:hypothetical protein [Methylobacterium marchantiae]|uniref:Uncharacterized protein n=1 Tax=Methylobacterium marchantiae TaxID=600331 RepID=A0ABW3X294_9HYPH
MKTAIGADTLITFFGDQDPSHMIILHNVSTASLNDGNFLFAPV